MIDVITMVTALFSGLLLGLFFFAGLFWTIKRGLWFKHPGAFFFGSLTIRIAVSLCVFYLVSDGSWQKLLICVAGFLVARFLLFHYSFNKSNEPLAIEESGHAS